MSKTLCSIEEICKICLSSDRKMYQLKSTVINLLTSCGLTLNTNANICWECNSILMKFHKFQEKAKHASELLEEYSKMQRKPEPLSGLSITECYSIDIDNKQEEQKKIGKQTQSSTLNNSSVNTNCQNNEKIRANKRKRSYQQEEKEEETITDNKEEFDVIKIETNEFDFDDEMAIECEEIVKEETFQKNISPIVKKRRSKKEEEYKDDRDKYSIVELSHDEMLQLREMSLSNLIKGNIKFKCDKCLLGFKTEGRFKKHNDSVHVKSNVRDEFCAVCECYVQDKCINTHLKSHYLAYKCTRCEYYCKDRGGAAKHYYSEHVYKGAHSCGICRRRFQDQSMLTQHKKLFHEPVECDVCNKKLRDKQSLKSHMVLHAEGTPMFQCGICFKYYRGRSGLRIHMAGVHQTQKPENAYCAECNIHYRSIHTYKLHLMQSSRHTGLANRLKCDQCGKTFISKQYLSKHIQIIHNKISKYSCVDCDKRFVGPKKLQNHINFVHNKLPKPRIFDCSVCHKKFSSKQVLKNHMNCHTGNRPYACELCDATFTQSGTLYKHKQLVHKIKKLSD